LVDESGFMLQPLVRRTWAPVGQTPVLRAWDRRDRLTAIAALVLSPARRRVDLFFQLQPRNAKAEDFLWFLNDVRLEIGRRLLVVWDRLGAHRRAETVLGQLGCPWARFESLPPYCPELNPVERVWSQIKYGDLCGWAPPDVNQLDDRVSDCLEDRGSDQPFLRGCFRWAGLDLD
jgi:hypothetical protein